jgi:hypothetical protein
MASSRLRPVILPTFIETFPLALLIGAACTLYHLLKPSMSYRQPLPWSPGRCFDQRTRFAMGGTLTSQKYPSGAVGCFSNMTDSNLGLS